ncbi:MAG: hypothetical protein PHO32_10315 [Candidatus Cloacimonetes bacterium]|nr:hypothetical protein [Candidatus Cloacimonadota bacterium]
MIAVLTCDIIASRIYTDVQRQALDTQLRIAFKASCLALPQAEADYLSFSIIQGDEFQFSLESPAFFYHFLLMFRNLLAIGSLTPWGYPSLKADFVNTETNPLHSLMPCFRAGIGIGTRSITAKANSYQMDGSAYHHSRTSMHNFEHSLNKHRLTIFHSDNPFVASSLNTILMFCDSIEQEWSERQRLAIFYTLEANSSLQTAIKMGVSRQNVEKLLKSANWDLICRSMDYFAAAEWLN